MDDEECGRNIVGIGLGRVPLARRLVRLLMIDRDSLAKADAMIVATMEMDVPPLLATRLLLRRFQTIRSKTGEDLTAWIASASKRHLANSRPEWLRIAITSALIQPWSNCKTEGQISKLKLVTRQICGRAELDPINVCVVNHDLHRNCVRATFAGRKTTRVCFGFRESTHIG